MRFFTIIILHCMFKFMDYKLQIEEGEHQGVLCQRTGYTWGMQLADNDWNTVCLLGDEDTWLILINIC